MRTFFALLLVIVVAAKKNELFDACSEEIKACGIDDLSMKNMNNIRKCLKEADVSETCQLVIYSKDDGKREKVLEACSEDLKACGITEFEGLKDDEMKTCFKDKELTATCQMVVGRKPGKPGKPGKPIKEVKKVIKECAEELKECGLTDLDNLQEDEMKTCLNKEVSKKCGKAVKAIGGKPIKPTKPTKPNKAMKKFVKACVEDLKECGITELDNLQEDEMKTCLQDKEVSKKCGKAVKAAGGKPFKPTKPTKPSKAMKKIVKACVEDLKECGITELDDLKEDEIKSCLKSQDKDSLSKKCTKAVHGKNEKGPRKLLGMF